MIQIWEDRCCEYGGHTRGGKNGRTVAATRLQILANVGIRPIRFQQGLCLNPSSWSKVHEHASSYICWCFGCLAT